MLSLPNPILMNIINQIKDENGEYQGNFNDEKTFKFVEHFLENDEFLKGLRKEGTEML